MTIDEQRLQMHQENRDLLIEIKTIVSKNEDRFIEHMKEDAMVQGKLSDSLTAVHRRVDGLFLGGILSIILMVAGFIVTVYAK